jgi:hypothetical protein
MSARAVLPALLAGVLALAGCLGPVSLHDAVIGYDRTVGQIEWELLLLNIARLRDQLPVHFTVTSNIAATFNYMVSAGVGGIYNDTPGFFAPNFSLGAAAGENPTLSIVPIQGREFTERVLTPMDEAKFEFLVFQGSPIDMVLRLMADGIEVQTPEGRFERFILNSPSRPPEYEEFRRLVLQLAELNAHRQLFVGRLLFVETTEATLSGPPPANEWRSAVERDFQWNTGPSPSVHQLKRRVSGRVAITNFDPRTLTDAERVALNAKAANNPRNFVLVDIRPGHPGGDWALYGAFKLRSLHRILDFVAEDGGTEREYDVAKDPRTREAGPNPAVALAVNVTESAPPPTGLPSATFRGRYFWVADTPWDRRAFRLLYQLFQMTVTDVSQVGLPITISK